MLLALQIQLNLQAENSNIAAINNVGDGFRGGNRGRKPIIIYLPRTEKVLEQPAPPKKKRKQRAQEIRAVVIPELANLAPAALPVDYSAIDAALERFSQYQIGYASMVTALNAAIEAQLAKIERRNRHKRIAMAMLLAA